MPIELPNDVHADVGPITKYPGHGPVTLINADGGDLVCVCLDCGYITDDFRRFNHIDCEPRENGIAKTWREHLNKYGFPGLGGEETDVA